MTNIHRRVNALLEKVEQALGYASDELDREADGEFWYFMGLADGYMESAEVLGEDVRDYWRQRHEMADICLARVELREWHEARAA